MRSFIPGKSCKVALKYVQQNLWSFENLGLLWIPNEELLRNYILLKALDVPDPPDRTVPGDALLFLFPFGHGPRRVNLYRHR